jgi:hypothetical protein
MTLYFRLDLLVDWLATKGKFYIALRFPTACRDRRSGGYVCKIRLVQYKICCLFAQPPLVNQVFSLIQPEDEEKGLAEPKQSYRRINYLIRNTVNIYII